MLKVMFIDIAHLPDLSSRSAPLTILCGGREPTDGYRWPAPRGPGSPAGRRCRWAISGLTASRILSTISLRSWLSAADRSMRRGRGVPSVVVMPVMCAANQVSPVLVSHQA